MLRQVQAIPTGHRRPQPGQRASPWEPPSLPPVPLPRTPRTPYALLLYLRSLLLCTVGAVTARKLRKGRAENVGEGGVSSVFSFLLL